LEDVLEGQKAKPILMAMEGKAFAWMRHCMSRFYMMQNVDLMIEEIVRR